MTNRYTQQAASAGYYGIFDRDMELSHAETVARLNELEERVAGLQGELDAARGHVEGLVKAVEADIKAEDRLLATPEDDPTWDDRAEDRQDSCATVIIQLNAARAWLRRAE